MFTLRRVEILSPKIVINLPWSFQKIYCKGEPYQVSVWQKKVTLCNRISQLEQLDKQAATPHACIVYQGLKLFQDQYEAFL